ncbi:MAG TPA: amino acid permease [Vicinamibacterales bacterium]|nr:amino acid permease [Vicinamibacterales bacterium]
MEGLTTAVRLERRLDLRAAMATNLIGMVGVGPFLTIPAMLTAMGGPHIIYAWIAGALLSLADGLVYAQLGAALPGTGGPYVYLREAYAPLGLGRLMAFLFIFQVLLSAPLSIASGAVGFANYLGFYWQTMTPIEHGLVAAATCVAMTALLYRNIESVGRLAVAMLVVVLATVGWIIVSGLFAFSPAQAFDFPANASRVDGAWWRHLSAATLIAIYNYGGYNNVCNIGGEVREPEKTLPRAIVLSIVAIAVMYVLMSTVIIGMVPWREAERSETIAALFIARTFRDPAAGHAAGALMTALILFVTASSLYALILGYSRVPFAAARDGQFFAVFGRLHPTKHFPDVSLLTIGAISLPFCFLSIGRIVNWLILVQIVTQSVWICAGAILLHRYRRDIRQPFLMWLYPIPAIVAAVMWTAIFVTGPRDGIVFSLVFVGITLAAYRIFSAG